MISESVLSFDNVPDSIVQFDWIDFDAVIVPSIINLSFAFTFEVVNGVIVTIGGVAGITIIEEVVALERVSLFAVNDIWYEVSPENWVASKLNDSWDNWEEVNPQDFP